MKLPVLNMSVGFSTQQWSGFKNERHSWSCLSRSTGERYQVWYRTIRLGPFDLLIDNER